MPCRYQCKDKNKVRYAKGRLRRFKFAGVDSAGDDRKDRAFAFVCRKDATY